MAKDRSLSTGECLSGGNLRLKKSGSKLPQSDGFYFRNASKTFEMSPTPNIRGVLGPRPQDGGQF